MLNHLVWGLEIFSTLVWGCVPPLAVLLLYYRRVRTAPPLAGVMLFFGVGIFAGLLAWGIERSFLIGLRQLNPWSSANLSPHLSFENLMLFQLGVLAPLQEACKLAGVVLPLIVMIRRYQRVPTQPSLVLLGTIAVAMGFTAQESALAIWRDQSLIMQQTIAAPMQAIFSAPWGLALGLGLCRMIRHLQPSDLATSDRITRPYKLTMRAWLTACLVHAGSNCWVSLSQAHHMSWLAYPMYAWWLWLWWLTEGFLARAQGKPTLRLITATTLTGRIQEYAIAIAALGVGGTALTFLRNFGNSVLFLWDLRETVDQSMAWFLGQEFLRTVVLAAIALYLFRYLRNRALQNL